MRRKQAVAWLIVSALALSACGGNGGGEIEDCDAEDVASGECVKEGKKKFEKKKGKLKKKYRKKR